MNTFLAIVVVTVGLFSKTTSGRGWNHRTCPRKCVGSADYKVAIYGTWSSARHPLDYPSNAHFSPILGASHNDDYVMWAPGDDASVGVQTVAETGNPAILKAELDSSDDVRESAVGSGPFDSTTTTYVEISVSKKYPYLSFISMIAPSPDWFISFRNIDMCDDETGQWKEYVVLDEIFAYDAGTDSGITFASADDATVPADPIVRIECGEGVFCAANEEFLSLATFTITLQ